jgi:electron transport complex protein RnfB
MSTVTPEQIDALLPQTQCGLCGYGGCMPYAEALVFEKAAIDLCPPGGVKGLLGIGALLGVDAKPFIPEMEKKSKPKLLAIIREDECIGCTKCIQACPVDAILGSAKHMHTVISIECTGCELCVDPCPVDCIDLVAVTVDESSEKIAADLARERFNVREKRLREERRLALLNKPQADKKSFVEQAVLRARLKKGL